MNNSLVLRGSAFWWCFQSCWEVDLGFGGVFLLAGIAIASCAVRGYFWRVRYAEKARFYHQIQAGVNSGLPLSRVLEVLGKGGGKKASIARKLAAAPDAEVLHGVWRHELGDLDGAVMAAGVISGRLGDAAGYLEMHYSAVAEAWRKIFVRMAYPLVVAHLGIVLLAVPAAIQGGGLPVFVRMVVGGLAVLYGILLVLFLGGAVLRWVVERSAIAEMVVRAVPGLGGWVRLVCAERFAATLGLAAGSGVAYGQGVQLAAESSGSACLREMVQTVMRSVRQGVSFADVFDRRNLLPMEVIEALRLGDEVGRMPEELRRVASELRGRVFRRLEVFSEWVPRLMYFAVAGYVAYGVVRTMQGVYGAYESILNSI